MKRVDRDEESPARLPGFGEDSPDGGDHHNEDGEDDERSSRSEFPFGGVVHGDGTGILQHGEQLGEHVFEWV
jgi:hypothetical protein